MSNPSSNLKASNNNLVIANFQLRTEEGKSLGYAPLGQWTSDVGTLASTATPRLVDPRYLFPDFTDVGNPDGTVWSKSGSTLAPLPNFAASTDYITISGVKVGLLG